MGGSLRIVAVWMPTLADSHVIFLQNAVGDACREQVQIIRAHHERCGALCVFSHGAPYGYHAKWSKVPMWMHWLQGAPDGEEAIGLDTDAVIVQPDKLNALPADADIGLIEAAAGTMKWLNTGVVFMRKRGDLLLSFFEAVLRMGPIPGRGLAGEQLAMNEILKRPECLVKLAVLPAEYNAYRWAPHDAPVIRAFHGEKDQAKILDGLKKATH